jgi:hypothetical protein
MAWRSAFTLGLLAVAACPIGPGVLVAAGARPIRLDLFDRGAASAGGDLCNAGGLLASNDHVHDLERSGVGAASSFRALLGSPPLGITSP